MKKQSTLLALRTLYHLSSKDLACLLHVSEITYYKYETGLHSTPLQAMYLLAEFYGVTLDFLYGRTQSTPRRTHPRKTDFFGQIPSQEAIMITIGEQLQTLRERQDLTQKTLGAYLGISRISYSYFENAKRQISAEYLRKLADYYNVTIDWLFRRTL